MSASQIQIERSMASVCLFMVDESLTLNGCVLWRFGFIKSSVPTALPHPACSKTFQSELTPIVKEDQGSVYIEGKCEATEVANCTEKSTSLKFGILICPLDAFRFLRYFTNC